MKFATLTAPTSTRKQPPASWSRSPIAWRPFRNGRIYIEFIKGPFLSEFKGSPAEYTAGLDLAIERGWLALHESGTYVKFTHKPARSYSPDGLQIRAPASI
jgi:hypothetical protein